METGIRNGKYIYNSEILDHSNLTKPGSEVTDIPTLVLEDAQYYTHLYYNK